MNLEGKGFRGFRMNDETGKAADEERTHEGRGR